MSSNKTHVIQGIIAKILEIPSSYISINKSTLYLGIDSQKAIIIRAELEEKYRVPIPVDFIISGPSIKEIADFITETEKEDFNWEIFDL